MSKKHCFPPEEHFDRVKKVLLSLVWAPAEEITKNLDDLPKVEKKFDILKSRRERSKRFGAILLVVEHQKVR